MRRKDREVSNLEEILNIVDKCEVIRIGMHDGKEPYIVPLNYGYHINSNELYFYTHCASEGRKIDILHSNPNVCFEMDCSFNLSKHEIPCKWSAYHESVMGTGIVNIITSVDEKKFAMDCIMKRYGFEGMPVYEESVFKKTTLLQLKVSEIVGKQNLPAASK